MEGNGALKGWLPHQLTLTNIVLIGGLLITFGYYVQSASQLRADFNHHEEAQEKYVAERRVAIEAAFAAVNVKILPIDSLQYRINIAEGQLNATNARIDRLADALQPLNDKIGLLTTRIEVLTTTLDRIAPVPPRYQPPNK